MHVIIDGYNLLGVTQNTAAPQARHSETARESLIRELSVYRQRKGHAVTVVFDGWLQGRPIEGREHRSGVEVIYSKRGEKADQVIQRLAREYGSDCAIVSSDHEVMNHARAHGAFVMGALEFAGKLHGTPWHAGAFAGKELDEGDDEQPRRGPEKKGNPRKLPKSQRRRSRQLGKF